jgi:hypothetical protein
VQTRSDFARRRYGTCEILKLGVDSRKKRPNTGGDGNVPRRAFGTVATLLVGWRAAGVVVAALVGVRRRDVRVLAV